MPGKKQDTLQRPKEKERKSERESKPTDREEGKLNEGQYEVDR